MRRLTLLAMLVASILTFSASTSKIDAQGQLNHRLFMPVVVKSDQTLIERVETPDNQERYRLVRAADGTWCAWSFLFYIQNEARVDISWPTCVELQMKYGITPTLGAVKIWVRPDPIGYGSTALAWWPRATFSEWNKFNPEMSVLQRDQVWSEWTTLNQTDNFGIGFDLNGGERRIEIRPFAESVTIPLGPASPSAPPRW